MKLDQLKEIIIQTIAIIEELLGNELTPKRELFCRFYATDRDCFGNGVLAYMQAYPDAKYASAQTSASDLLLNPIILRRIRELMDIHMDEIVADKELHFIMLQNAELNPKLGAIKHYNELKQRVTKKLDITSGDEPLQIAGPIYVRKNDGVREDSGTEQAA